MTEHYRDNDEFTEGQLAVIEKKIFEALPCSTNKTCQQIVDLKTTVKGIDFRTWIILVSIIISTLITIALKYK